MTNSMGRISCPCAAYLLGECMGRSHLRVQPMHLKRCKTRGQSHFLCLKEAFVLPVAQHVKQVMEKDL